jgi:predicted type IV restriction endonuclease
MDKDKITLKQIANKIQKSFDNWDYHKAINRSNNEAETRDYLIEPFLNILGYDKMDDYAHEFPIRLSKGKVKKVDMVITISGKSPSILIECKQANANLTETNFKQLSKYYQAHKESTNNSIIGILTNGIIYKFYSRCLEDKSTLNKNPFLVFNLNDFNSSDIENLVAFYRPSISSIKHIVEDAEEIYFLDKFDNGFFETLYKPNKDLIKLVYSNMGGGRMSDKINKRIYDLINSISLAEVLEKIKIVEAKDSKDGIITTSEELKAFDIIKTIIAMTSKINNNDLERIGYRDYKGFSKIIVDGKPQKEICRLVFSENRSQIEINKNEYPINDISAKEITKHKRHLVNSAINELKK